MSELKKNIKSYVYLKKRKNSFGQEIISDDILPKFEEIIQLPYGYYYNEEKRIGILIIKDLLDEENKIKTSFIIDFNKFDSPDSNESIEVIDHIKEKYNVNDIYHSNSDYISYIGNQIKDYTDLINIIKETNTINLNAKYCEKIQDLFNYYENGDIDLIEIILMSHKSLCYNYNDYNEHLKGLNIIDIQNQNLFYKELNKTLNEDIQKQKSIFYK